MTTSLPALRPVVRVVPKVDGVYLVQMPDEAKDTAVWRYRLREEDAARMRREHVWRCERHTDRHIEAAPCVHIEAAMEVTP